MQGPNAPWCVGSVFFPPQLLTSDLGPLIFNPMGDPQRLLSTGQRVQQLETAISTSKQTESFIQGCAAPFFPRDLLQDHLLLDSSSNQNSLFYGNLLQGLKCSDGRVVVFSIYGEGTNRIASTVCHQGSGGTGYSIRTSLSSRSSVDSERTDWSVSPSMQHSVQQLSAVWADFSGKGATGLAIVAARTNYHVYFCTVSIEEDQVHFISTAVSKFQVPTAHVTWSPYVNGRAAVILESGTLCFFEIKASKNSNLSGFVDLIPISTLRCPIQRFSAMLRGQSTAMSHNQYQEHGHNEPEFGNDLQGLAEGAAENVPGLEKKWWCCEFGWLPHTMLIANAQEIFLVDLIEQNCHDFTFHASRKSELNTKSPTDGIDLMANVGASEYSRFCSLKSGEENIVAFGRDSNDGIYEFSVATEHHVILFDTRQPQTPILQWEHGMRQDPPSLLIMCPLSALRSVEDKDKLKDIQNGRVILAASFKSGDIRVFCYGSGVPAVELPLSNNPKRQKVEGYDLGNATYAWDIPSVLYAPLADVDDWRDILSSSQGLYGHGLFVPKARKGGQNIAGIVLLSDNPPEPTCNERKNTFTILQLTGQGELLAQTYKASHELQDPPKATISSITNNSDPEESVGAHPPKYHEPKFEVLPTFLKYIQTGSILNPHSSRSSQKEQESVGPDDSEYEFIAGQDQVSGAPCEFMNKDPPVLNPNLEKTVCKADLETQLKVLVRELNVPLSIVKYNFLVGNVVRTAYYPFSLPAPDFGDMYEVARKVLGMGLPERLSHLNPGLLSDLNAHWHRGYKFPLVSPLLGSTVPSPTSGDPRGAGEPSEDALSNDLTWKASFQETIPLPLLLEVHNIEKPNAVYSLGNGGKGQTNPLQSCHLVQGEYLPDTKHSSASKWQKHNDVTSVDGDNLLLEGSQYVESLIEQFVSKNESTVISLVEPTQELRETPNRDGQLGSQILLYTMREKGVCPANFGRVDSEPEESFIATDKAADRRDVAKTTEGVVLRETKEKSRTFVEDLYSKFVAGKAAFENQESHPAKQYLKIDPNLCPIKLCFTDQDEELEPGELTALEDMQASFLQWQQSFSSYRTSR